MRICISLKPEDQERMIAEVLKNRGYISAEDPASVLVAYRLGHGKENGTDPGEGVYATASVVLPSKIAASLYLNRNQMIELISESLVKQGFVEPYDMQFQYQPQKHFLAIHEPEEKDLVPTFVALVKEVPGLRPIERQAKPTKPAAGRLQLSNADIKALIYAQICSLGYRASETSWWQIELGNKNGHIPDADLDLTANMLVFLPDGLETQIYLEQAEFKATLAQSLIAYGYVFDPQTIEYSYKADTGIESERASSGVRAIVPVAGAPVS